MELTIEQALQQGIAAHKEGKLQEAEHLYRAILNSQSNHPDANHNLGVLAVGVGKVQEALPLLKLALETSPKHGQFWLSYIDAFIRIGQLDNAKDILQRGKAFGLKGREVDQLEVRLNSALKSNIRSNDKTMRPSKQQIDGLIKLYTQGKSQEAIVQGSILANQFSKDPAIPNILAAIYSDLGKHEEAINYCNKAIELKPDFAEAYNNRGLALKNISHYEEAISSYNKAIELNRHFAEAYSNLANILNQMHYIEKGIISAKKSISLKPNFADAYDSLGIGLKKMGRWENSVTSFSRVIKLDPKYLDAYDNLISILVHYETSYFSNNLANDYLKILNLRTMVRPADLSRPIIKLLKNHSVIKSLIDSRGATKDSSLDYCKQLSRIPLLLKLMELTPIPDLEIEGFLTGIRRNLLFKKKDLLDIDLIQFQVSLALQCFTNEFIYEETETEVRLIKSLETKLEKLALRKENLAASDIVCLASYRTLGNYFWIRDTEAPLGLEELFKRQIWDVVEERKLRRNLPSLGLVRNAISSKVQKHYEENPYPRWLDTRINTKSQGVEDLLILLNLRSLSKNHQFQSNPEILIAGCGTGQHALSVASRFADSQITAIDLSHSSLSYAMRRTNELGITNINYIQGDILDLVSLKSEFDIIECVGVIHHMEDPIAGWSALLDRLKPGGLMKIGLYSEKARKNIVRARLSINSDMTSLDMNNMRRIRSRLIAEKNPFLYELALSKDFYSGSSLRDLLFHAQEHHFTIPKIDMLIKKLGLIFIGFEFPDSRFINKFTSHFPQRDAIYDLTKWDRFERLNSNFFAGMYQFWTQKI